MVWKLKEEVKDNLDPYLNKRGTDDAILTMLHNVIKHLEDPNAQARFVFLDLSTAFNIMQPHLMLSKLKGGLLCKNHF